MHLVEQIPIEQMFYGRFVSYDALKRIINVEFINSQASEINIFIDLYQFLTPPHMPVRINDFFTACSTVINYCAHLRYFFRRYYRVESNIILVGTNGTCKKSSMCIKEYNKYYSKKMELAGDAFKSMVESNLNLLKLICPYLPNIYFKFGSVDATIMIKDIIDKGYFPNNPNIIISPSQFMYQLPSVNPNVIVIRQARKFADDLSYSYNAGNCLHTFAMDIKKMMIFNPMNPKLITMLMILTGLPKLHVPSMVNITTALSIIDTILPGIEHDCLALYDAYQKFYMMKENRKKKATITPEEFKNRFMAIDIVYQSLLYQNMSESKQTTFLSRKVDPDGVKKINEKYFKSNPIILENL